MKLSQIRTKLPGMKDPMTFYSNQNSLLTEFTTLTWMHKTKTKGMVRMRNPWKVNTPHSRDRLSSTFLRKKKVRYSKRKKTTLKSQSLAK